MAYSISPLLTGVRNPDQGIMTYQQGYGERIWLPVWAFLLRGEGHNILVDTGLDENELIAPAGFTEETGLVPETLVDCLRKKRLSAEEIDVVINTHLCMKITAATTCSFPMHNFRSPCRSRVLKGTSSHLPQV